LLLVAEEAAASQPAAVAVAAAECYLEALMFLLILIQLLSVQAGPPQLLELRETLELEVLQLHLEL
jgi:hypothetical protein